LESSAAAWRVGSVARDEKPILASQSVSNSVSMLISGSLDGFPVDHAGWRIRDMPEKNKKKLFIVVFNSVA
jgi:hypothetical protein